MKYTKKTIQARETSFLLSDDIDNEDESIAQISNFIEHDTDIYSNISFKSN